jgi:hypothetical protein
MFKTAKLKFIHSTAAQIGNVHLPYSEQHWILSDATM